MNVVGIHARANKKLDAREETDALASGMYRVRKEFEQTAKVYDDGFKDTERKLTALLFVVLAGGFLGLVYVREIVEAIGQFTFGLLVGTGFGLLVAVFGILWLAFAAKVQE
jgi:hypothetical protein